jgi:hypothetical protein
MLGRKSAVESSSGLVLMIVLGLPCFFRFFLG